MLQESVEPTTESRLTIVIASDGSLFRVYLCKSSCRLKSCCSSAQFHGFQPPPLEATFIIIQLSRWDHLENLETSICILNGIYHIDAGFQKFLQ